MATFKKRLFTRQNLDKNPPLEDTILRDLKYLMDKGVVKKLGSTKAAKYILNK